MILAIIQIIPTISQEASGGTNAILGICKSLIDLHQDITLTTLNWAPLSSTHSFHKQFPVAIGPRRLGRSPAMRRWLINQVKLNNVDLLHNHSLWMMPNVYPGQIAKQYGIPLVVSPHGTMSAWAMKNGSSIKRYFWSFQQRPALDATTCFHATAFSEYEDIRRLGFNQPVAIIPNGISIPEWLPEKQNKSRTLLFLGRIHPKKGIDILLPAWRAVQDHFPEWRLQIVGPDNRGYLKQMQHLASDLHLERVEFSGVLFGEQKHLTYRQADLFVLPTYSENFGISVAEALAAGTPAIVTKGAPWSGLEKHGAGWWIDIGLDALINCLEEAMGFSQANLSKMGLRGQNWMEAEYSWNQVGKQMMETYQWILHGGNKPDFIIED